MPSTAFFLFFAAFIATGNALNCYICNSDEYPACGNPFEEDDAIIGQLLKNCNDRDVPHPVYKDPTTGRDIVARYTFCTKTTQQEARQGTDHEVVIRGCGFRNDTRLMPEEGEDPNALKCVETEAPQGDLFYCACYANACNTAGRMRLVEFLIPGVFLMGIARFF